MWIPLLLAACAAPSSDDTGEPVADTEETVDHETCDTLEIRVTGDDPPQVGDAWTVWLWCDDSIELGTMRMFFDPPEIASVSTNNATFLQAGEAELTVQAGGLRQTRTVTVGE
jgi:hypothetical protein